MQADVGTPGSEQHAQRERMLRSSLAMQSQLTACKHRLQSLGQQLADLSKATAPSVQPANPAAHYSPSRAVSQAQAGIMDDLFGSDDDESLEAEAKPAAAKSSTLAQSPKAALALSAEAAGCASADNAGATRMHAKGATQDLPSVRKGSLLSSTSVQPVGQGAALSSEQKPRLPMDPAAPKRSISFHNSIRRKQSGAKQRAQAFNDAADAAIAEAVATARSRSTQPNASDLASQPVHVQHASDSNSLPPSAATASHTPWTTGPNNTQHKPRHLQHKLADPSDLTAPVATPVQSDGAHNARGTLDAGAEQTAEHSSSQSEGTHLAKQVHASSTKQSALPQAAPPQLPVTTAAVTTAVPSRLQEEEPVSTVTRPAKAEVAPKLKVYQHHV